MCVALPSMALPDGARAARLLAAEMSEQLGVSVDAETVRRWVERRWSVISPLAHTIHDADVVMSFMAQTARIDQPDVRT